MPCRCFCKCSASVVTPSYWYVQPRALDGGGCEQTVAARKTEPFHDAYRTGRPYAVKHLCMSNFSGQVANWLVKDADGRGV